MKGVTYNLKFRLTHNQFVEYENLDMVSIINQITNNFKTYYDINVTITNQTIYNLIVRPNTSSKLVRCFCIVTKYVSND